MTLLLYTAPFCEACDQIKEHLDRLGLAYTVRDLMDPQAVAEVKAYTKDGDREAPMLLLRSGRRKRFYIGYSKAGFDAWLKKEGVVK